MLQRGTAGGRGKKLVDVLSYRLGMGKDEDWIVERHLREGIPLPDDVENAPGLLLGLELYWYAFSDLHTCRAYGWDGPLPIPWDTVAEYAVVHELDEEQSDRLWYFVDKMDREFMRFARRKDGSKQDSGRVRTTHRRPRR